MLFWDLPIMRLARNEGGGNLSEFVIERLVVQKHPVVVVVPVEAVFNLPD